MYLSFPVFFIWRVFIETPIISDHFLSPNTAVIRKEYSGPPFFPVWCIHHTMISLCRVMWPIRLCYAWTIWKVQAQTFVTSLGKSLLLETSNTNNVRGYYWRSSAFLSLWLMHWFNNEGWYEIQGWFLLSISLAVVSFADCVRSRGTRSNTSSTFASRNVC